MAFADDRQDAFGQLQAQFPNATHISQFADRLQQNALFIFKKDWTELSEIKLHLKGTVFQLKVWEALLKIPVGGLINLWRNSARLCISRQHHGR
jgi:AraC family transcriptional regulator of adaptative response/methylated-DNA-[protein]-cysteine methyltransferase